MRLTLSLLFIFLLHSQCEGQNNVDINHIFFCVDSTTYNKLFENETITQLLANTRESSTKTLTESWTGKYIFGRNSFIEIFSEGSYAGGEPSLGDKFADLGIAFKTKILGDIEILKEKMEVEHIPKHFETTEFESNGKYIKWNHILFINNPSIQNNFRPYVEEKAKDFLLMRGFSEQDISKELTEEVYREKLRGKKYDKLFDTIEKIKLLITREEFTYLSETLKLFGFSQKGNKFTDGRCEVTCKIEPERKFRVKEIQIHLLDKIEKTHIKISDHLDFKANKYSGRFIFKYDK